MFPPAPDFRHSIHGWLATPHFIRPLPRQAACPGRYAPVALAGQVWYLTARLPRRRQWRDKAALF